MALMIGSPDSGNESLSWIRPGEVFFVGKHRLLPMAGSGDCVRLKTQEQGSEMLILSRKECEEIVIDGHIRLRIIRVQGNRVRIGIDAPEGVAVLRAELRPSAMKAGARLTPCVVEPAC